MGLKEKLVKLSEINKYRADRLQRVREIWNREVSALYEEIENWFAEYSKDGYISVSRGYSEPESSESGEVFFVPPVLELNLGGGVSVILEPSGTNVIGAFGKIDLYLRGHKDKKILLLLIKEEDADEKFHWEVWENRKQQEQILFDKKTFEQILEQWLESVAKV